jgi:phage transcriptional repressor
MARGRGKYTPNDIEIMKRISVNINELLNRTRTKQVELSKSTGIPTSTLTGYVKGTSMPNPGNVQKIADFFNARIPPIENQGCLCEHFPKDDRIDPFGLATK